MNRNQAEKLKEIRNALDRELDAPLVHPLAKHYTVRVRRTDEKGAVLADYNVIIQDAADPEDAVKQAQRTIHPSQDPKAYTFKVRA